MCHIGTKLRCKSCVLFDIISSYLRLRIHKETFLPCEFFFLIFCALLLCTIQEFSLVSQKRAYNKNHKVVELVQSYKESNLTRTKI